jgi:ABC-2 type transport system ATP-binding protein
MSSPQPRHHAASRRRTATVASALVAIALVVAGCSTTATTSSAPSVASGSTPAADGSGPGTTVRTACRRPPASPVEAAPVPGTPTDNDLTSFDGAKIRFHWFPDPSASVNQPAPTVLMGPGWGLPGDTNVSAVGVLGAINIASLQRAGYNVLTWDPRGFGSSGGAVEVDSADFEGKDVERLIDWVATQSGVQLDGAGDPRMGMIGGSYGGGIQLVTAGIDCRVDAIVPVIAWHELTSSLYKADTIKAGWANALSLITRGRNVDEHVTHSNQVGQATGVLDADDQAWFAQRGVDDLLEHINVPTLIIQGTVDTLFTLDEGVTNYRALRDRGVPTAMVWFCGGHGICLTDPGDPERVSKSGIAWLNRYVKNDPSVDTGARVDIVDQDGTAFHADDYPFTAGTPVTADGTGTLSLTADGGAGPVPAAKASGAGLLGGIATVITPAQAANAVNVPIPTPTTSTNIVGAPQLKFTYTGTPGTGDKPTRVFAQIVDEATGLTVGNQVTPIDVTLDGQAHDVTTPLEIVSYTTHTDTHLTLQLVATTVSYGTPQLGGSVDFSAVHLELPAVTNLSR